MINSNDRDNKIRNAYLDHIIEKYGFSLSVEDLCELLQVSRPQVDRLIHLGVLPVAKIGRQTRMTADDFVIWWRKRVEDSQREAQIRLLRGE